MIIDNYKSKNRKIKYLRGMSETQKCFEDDSKFYVRVDNKVSYQIKLVISG